MRIRVKKKEEKVGNVHPEGDKEKEVGKIHPRGEQHKTC